MSQKALHENAKLLTNYCRSVFLARSTPKLTEGAIGMVTVICILTVLAVFLLALSLWFTRGLLREVYSLILWMADNGQLLVLSCLTAKNGFPCLQAVASRMLSLRAASFKSREFILLSLKAGAITRGLAGLSNFQRELVRLSLRRD